ncbi:hypothetical protein J6590_013619 [Homalodisca vitripennis]|nr:hypothetical protein J6590_013619 [Homalodisca vitripennis]
MEKSQLDVRQTSDGLVCALYFDKRYVIMVTNIHAPLNKVCITYSRRPAPARTATQAQRTSNSAGVKGTTGLKERPIPFKPYSLACGRNLSNRIRTRADKVKGRASYEAEEADDEDGPLAEDLGSGGGVALRCPPSIVHSLEGHHHQSDGSDARRHRWT